MSGSKSYTINTQIIIIFLLVTGLLLVSSGLNHMAIIRYEKGIHFIKNISVEQLSLLNSIQQNVTENKLRIIHFLLSDDHLKKEFYEFQLDSIRNQNDNNFVLFSEIADDEDVKEKLFKVLLVRQEYLKEIDRALNLSSNAGLISIAQFEEQELRPAYNRYRNELSELTDIIISETEQEVQSTMDSIHRARKTSNVLISVGLAVLLIMSILLIRIIRRLKMDYDLLIEESKEREKAQKQFKALNEKLEERIAESTSSLKQTLKEKELTHAKLQKVNEELSALKLIIDLSDNPIIIRTPEDSITFWNKGAESFYGCKKEEAIGEVCRNFIERKFSESYDDIMKKIHQDGYWHGDIIFFNKHSGEETIVSSSWKLFKGENNVPVSILEIDHDITHRIEMEEEIRRYNKELIEVNSAKDKIFSVLSHDLRNPVASLVSTSEILKKLSGQPESPEVKQFAEIIHRTSLKLLEQLSDLVEWAKSLNLKSTFNPKRMRLCLELNHALKLIMPMADNKNIRLENKLPEHLFVFADRYMLRSIFQNLITNAIKFTPREGHIIVTAQENINEIELNIIDTGIGMPEEVSEKLFGPFQQTDSSEIKPETVTGLGLILVKDFIMRHGGQVRVDSSPGKGTKVSFTLPKAQGK
jgi:PAS domain S-box-containing protein